MADPVPAARPRDPGDPAGEARTDAQIGAVFSYWRTTVPEWKEANDRIEALWKQHPEGSSQLVLEERDEPRETHMLAARRFPQAGQAGRRRASRRSSTRCRRTSPPNRLTFARWLVDRQAPTTARSIVNRIWQAYFGTGLVSTSEDLGSQCEAPSHPELLDWLAVEFMDSGWSLKHLHRLIVDSATYRQSSRVTPELLATRPVQPPAGARAAVPGRCRARPRHRPGGQRPARIARSAAPSV